MNSAAPLQFRHEGSNPLGIHFSGSRRRAFRETACAFLGDSRLSSASCARQFPLETALTQPLCNNLCRMIELQKSIKTNNFNSLQNRYLQKTGGVGSVMVTQRLSTFNFRLSTSFTCFHALTTERKEGKALNDQRTIAKSAGPITSSVHSGGESWNGVENGGERESGFQEGAARGFHCVLLLE